MAAEKTDFIFQYHYLSGRPALGRWRVASCFKQNTPLLHACLSLHLGARRRTLVQLWVSNRARFLDRFVERRQAGPRDAIVLAFLP